MQWECLREEEFAPMLDRTNRVCAIAIGCLEKQGQHLPLGTDAMKGGRILELAAEREEVCVFPRLYLGDLQGEQARKAGEGVHYGFVSLSAELLLNLMRELCDEIGRNGFKKILLFNSHGGNRPFLENFVRAATDRKKDYEVFLYYNSLVKPDEVLKVIRERGRSYFPALTDTDIAVLEDWVATGKFDGHGGFAESAMVMGTYPELVRLDRCEVESGLSTHVADPLSDAGIKWGRMWQANYPNSYAGKPPLGLTQQIADATVEIAVEKTAAVLKLLKDDKIMDPILAAGYRQ